MKILAVAGIKNHFNPFKTRTSYTIVILLEGELLMAYFVKSIAEFKQNNISFLFPIDGCQKFIDHHDELGFSGALLLYSRAGVHSIYFI